MKRIQNEEGEWLKDQNSITDATTEFYQKQFSKEAKIEVFNMMDKLQTLVTEDLNE